MEVNLKATVQTADMMDWSTVNLKARVSGAPVIFNNSFLSQKGCSGFAKNVPQFYLTQRLRDLAVGFN